MPEVKKANLRQVLTIFSKVYISYSIEGYVSYLLTTMCEKKEREIWTMTCSTEMDLQLVFLISLTLSLLTVTHR